MYNKTVEIYLKEIIMRYYKPNGRTMSKNEAMCDSLRRQTEGMRSARSQAEKMAIYRSHVEERQNIMKNYDKEWWKK